MRSAGGYTAIPHPAAPSVRSGCLHTPFSFTHFLKIDVDRRPPSERTGEERAWMGVIFDILVVLSVNPL